MKSLTAPEQIERSAIKHAGPSPPSHPHHTDTSQRGTSARHWETGPKDQPWRDAELRVPAEHRGVGLGGLSGLSEAQRSQAKSRARLVLLLRERSRGDTGRESSQKSLVVEEKIKRP